MGMDIGHFQNIIDELMHFPLISVGSGGSLTSALYASLLHRKTSKMSIYSTPLEMQSLGEAAADASILFITAGGGNYDLLNSFKFAAENEPRSLNILCATKDSAIKDLARKYDCVNVFDFDLPCGKDGFLATNSLLSFNIILLKAYRNDLCNKSELPQTLGTLVYPGVARDDFTRELKDQFGPLLERETYSVLFGEWGKPAAFDLESKFTEASLGNVQLADYRNFAHGRHNWLAKRGKHTGVIAFVTPEEKKIAEKTLAIIPKDIPVLRICTNAEPGPLASLDLLIKTMFIVDIMGEAINIDPGRPGVADFGVKMYNLHLPLKTSKFPNLSAIESAAVLRKLRNFASFEHDTNTIVFWTKALHTFIYDLASAQFGSVVLNYDGTICEPKNRYTGISNEVSTLISNLLENGITIGIATGRGKSVREDLQRTISPRHWSNVFIGYYNGSDIGKLADNDHPNKDADFDPKLESLMEAIKGQEGLIGIAKSECRPKQISFEPTRKFSLFEMMNSLRNVVERNNLYGIQILESSHSVDVLAPNVTKVNLVRKVNEQISNKGSAVKSLCIGDKGKWPGNDSALLSTQYSLSADTVSADPNTCWNIAPPGHRSVQATIGYLQALTVVEKGFMRFTYNRNPVKIN